ncbi:hypothetical protein K458DRAFT_102411 [Lentithecium fluviatile CBS 122367]|uniref:Uncharacterized protein n=1 Tax=Lentithecium fluviatile CBS 122367 TaxID=1168545 RepID=A0A6G1JJP0_9PLEO|nr:hypothetical protein K458DRAFT_102411 [Lentithecium fluviatile CBS 122367]
MLRSSAPSDLLRVMPFSPRARRCGTSQTLSVGNGLTRKPISNCILCIVAAIDVFGLRRRFRIAVSQRDDCCCVRWLVSYCVACSQILLVCPAAAATATLQVPNQRGGTRDGL